MTGSEPRGANFAVSLTAATDRRLAELADDAGLSKSKLAGHLLEELMPTLKSVKTRLQITRSSPADQSRG